MKAAWLALLLATASLSADPGLIRGRFELKEAATGRQVTQASFAGKLRLVFFGFTHCPLTCPRGLDTLGKVLKELGPDARAIAPLFITLDPKRDSPAVMMEYLKGFNPAIIGLTGNDRAIARAKREFRLESERVEAGASGYLLEHPALFYLMDEKGRFLKTLPSSGDAKSLAGQIKAYLK